MSSCSSYLQMCRAHSTLGSVHSDSAIRLFKAMKAPHRTIETLRTGVKLTLTKGKKIKKVVDNNKSALNNFDTVNNKLKEWLEAGHISVIPEHKARYISPLSCSMKYDPVKRCMKKRICFDSSRFKGRFVFPGSKLPELRYARTFIHPYDELAVCDFSNFYFHFQLHEESKPLVCVKWNLDGGPAVVLQFNVLIYGLQPATAEVGLVTRVITDYLRRKFNIIVLVYIDDSLCIFRSSPYQNLLAFKKVVAVFIAVGFVINFSKVSFPKTKQKVLGLWLDTEEMKIRPVRSKDHELIHLYEGFTGVVPLTEIAKIVGKCMALELAIRIPVRLYFPKMFKCLAQFIDPEDDSSWDQLLQVPQCLRDEFGRFLREYPYYQGAPLHDPLPHRSFSSEMLPTIPDTKLFASDAGADFAILMNVNKTQDIEIKKFDVTQKQYSSSHRELLALQMILRPGVVEDNQVISFLTDSRTVETWMRTGTSNAAVADTLLDIYKELDKRNITLVVAWRPRNSPAISLVDRSQRLSSDDFGLDFKDLSWLYTILKGRRFVCDVFAHPLCNICLLYTSPSPRDS